MNLGVGWEDRLGLEGVREEEWQANVIKTHILRRSQRINENVIAFN